MDVSYIDMTPLNVLEVPHATIETLWIRGGFPDSFLAGGDRQSLDWRKELLRTYLERDVPMFGSRIPAETLRRFWTMLAHNQGALHNASRLTASNLRLCRGARELRGAGLERDVKNVLSKAAGKQGGTGDDDTQRRCSLPAWRWSHYASDSCLRNIYEGRESILQLKKAAGGGLDRLRWSLPSSAHT